MLSPRFTLQYQRAGSQYRAKMTKLIRVQFCAYEVNSAIELSCALTLPITSTNWSLKWLVCPTDNIQRVSYSELVDLASDQASAYPAKLDYDLSSVARLDQSALPIKLITTGQHITSLLPQPTRSAV
jgi:hypothetical protein